MGSKMGDLKYFAASIFLLIGLFLCVLSLLAYLFEIPGLEIILSLSFLNLTVSLILFLKKKMSKK